MGYTISAIIYRLEYACIIGNCFMYSTYYTPTPITYYLELKPTIYFSLVVDKMIMISYGRRHIGLGEVTRENKNAFVLSVTRKWFTGNTRIFVNKDGGCNCADDSDERGGRCIKVRQ